MSMELDAKLSSLVQLLFSIQSKKILSANIHSSLISRLNTLVFILKESSPEAIPKSQIDLLEQLLGELQELLESINEGGESILQKFRNMLPGSNIKKLQAMIPRLLEVSDVIVEKSTLYNTRHKSVNGKRHATQDAAIDLTDEIKTGPDPHKKIHKSEVDEDNEVIIIGSSNGNNKVENSEERKPSKVRAFSIKYVMDPELEKYFTTVNKTRTAYWHGTAPIAEIVLRREDFRTLPENMALRMSKEHAKLTAQKLEKGVQFEISDLSVNGIYYLGNKIDGDYIKGKAWRIKKHVTYRMKHGDIIGILMNKDTGNKDMLLGFEFLIDENLK